MTSPLQQKIKITGPVVVTANRVGDGAVIYRGPDGHWTTRLGEAVVTTDPTQARHLVDAATADSLRVVDAYIAPVKLTRNGDVLPGNLRERIRSRGPTIDLPATLAFEALRQE
jgi:predicted NAD/FAD-binding protein